MHLEAKKNLPEKRKKEKLPLDVAPSSKQSFEQVFAVEMDETDTKTTEPEASSVHKDEIQSSTQGVCDSAVLNLLPFSMTTARPLKNINVMERVSLFPFQLLNLVHVLPSV